MLLNRVVTLDMILQSLAQGKNDSLATFTLSGGLKIDYSPTGLEDTSGMATLYLSRVGVFPGRSEIADISRRLERLSIGYQFQPVSYEKNGNRHYAVIKFYEVKR